MRNIFSILYLTGFFSILFLISMLSLVFYHLPDIIYTIRDKKERTELVSSSYKEPTPETPIVVEETKKEEKVEPVTEKKVKPVVPPPTQEKEDSLLTTEDKNAEVNDSSLINNGLPQDSVNQVF